MSVPGMENGGRWHHIASEAELEQVLSATKAGSDYQVTEMPYLNITFLATQRPIMAIVRAGAMGGDVRNVEGAWIYDNPFSMLMDWNEIKSVNQAAPKGS